jgi:hypothetical protein
VFGLDVKVPAVWDVFDTITRHILHYQFVFFLTLTALTGGFHRPGSPLERLVVPLEPFLCGRDVDAELHQPSPSLET